MLVARSAQQRTVERVGRLVLGTLGHAQRRPVREQQPQPRQPARGGRVGRRQQQRVFRLEVAVRGAVLGEGGDGQQHLVSERRKVALRPARRHAALHQLEQRDARGEDHAHETRAATQHGALRTGRRDLVRVPVGGAPYARARAHAARAAGRAGQQRGLRLHLPAVERQRHAPRRARVAGERLAHPLEVLDLEAHALRLLAHRDRHKPAAARTVGQQEGRAAVRVEHVLPAGEAGHERRGGARDQRSSQHRAAACRRASVPRTFEEPRPASCQPEGSPY